MEEWKWSAWFLNIRIICSNLKKKKKKNFWKHGGFIIVSQSQNSNYSFLFAIVMEIQDT